MLDAGEDGEGEFGALRFSVGVVEATKVVGVGMEKGDCVVCSGCGCGSDGGWVGCGSEWSGCCASGGVCSDMIGFGYSGGGEVTPGSSSECDGC